MSAPAEKANLAEAAPKADLSQSACAEQFAQLTKCSVDNGEKAAEACAEISKVLDSCIKDNNL